MKPWGRTIRKELVIVSKKYLGRYIPEHLRADSRGYIRESLFVAEKAFGKNLPDGAIVHHINHIETDNRPQNLIICQNPSYHQKLHEREKAFWACGHSSWRKCCYCHQWDDPENLHLGRESAYHRKCMRIHFRQQYKIHNEISV